MTCPCERGHQGRVAAKHATASCSPRHDEVQASAVLWLHAGRSRVGEPPRLHAPLGPRRAPRLWHVWPPVLGHTSAWSPKASTVPPQPGSGPHLLGQSGRASRRRRRNATSMACGGQVVAASAGMAVSHMPACGPACIWFESASHGIASRVATRPHLFRPPPARPPSRTARHVGHSVHLSPCKVCLASAASCRHVARPLPASRSSVYLGPLKQPVAQGHKGVRPGSPVRRRCCALS